MYACYPSTQSESLLLLRKISSLRAIARRILQEKDLRANVPKDLVHFHLCDFAYIFELKPAYIAGGSQGFEPIDFYPKFAFYGQNKVEIGSAIAQSVATRAQQTRAHVGRIFGIEADRWAEKID